MKVNLTVIMLAFYVAAASGQPNNRIARTPKVTYDWREGFVSLTEFTGELGLGETEAELSRY